MGAPLGYEHSLPISLVRRTQPRRDDRCHTPMHARMIWCAQVWVTLVVVITLGIDPAVPCRLWTLSMGFKQAEVSDDSPDESSSSTRCRMTFYCLCIGTEQGRGICIDLDSVPTCRASTFLVTMTLMCGRCQPKQDCVVMEVGRYAWQKMEPHVL